MMLPVLETLNSKLGIVSINSGLMKIRSLFSYSDVRILCCTLGTSCNRAAWLHPMSGLCRSPASSQKAKSAIAPHPLSSNPWLMRKDGAIGEADMRGLGWDLHWCSQAGGFGAALETYTDSAYRRPCHNQSHSKGGTVGSSFLAWHRPSYLGPTARLRRAKSKLQRSRYLKQVIALFSWVRNDVGWDQIPEEGDHKRCYRDRRAGSRNRLAQSEPAGRLG
jgi:hypothetical protein